MCGQFFSLGIKFSGHSYRRTGLYVPWVVGLCRPVDKKYCVIREICSAEYVLFNTSVYCWKVTNRRNIGIDFEKKKKNINRLILPTVPERLKISANVVKTYNLVTILINYGLLCNNCYISGFVNIHKILSLYKSLWRGYQMYILYISKPNFLLL